MAADSLESLTNILLYLDRVSISGRGWEGWPESVDRVESPSRRPSIAQLLNKPPKFLNERARVLAPEAAPPVLVLCAGYDEQRWRAEALVEHLCQWIPEWALRYGELDDHLDSAPMMAMSRHAARKVYTSKNSRAAASSEATQAADRQELDT